MGNQCICAASAGFSRLDITPPVGTGMDGYYFARKAEGMLDPLTVNAVAFAEGNRTAVVLVCDLLGLYPMAGRRWHKEIARRIGVAPEAVFLCHTHTHTGPAICGGLIPNGAVESAYDQWLFERLCNAAQLAMADCKPILHIRAWEGMCKGASFVRRFKMKNGHYQTWAKYCDPNIEGYACEGDESLRFVRIARADGEELLFVNFQCHPDNISGNLFSADYPAFLRKKIEGQQPNTKCIYLNGAEGQLVFYDWWHDSILRTKYKTAICLGEKLADTVLENYESAKLIESKGVVFGQKILQCKTKLDPNRLAEAQRIIMLHESGRDDEIGLDSVVTPMVAEAYHHVELAAGNLEYLPVTISAITVGGLALLGIPGEPFCELGKYIRNGSPFSSTMVCCQTNGAEGYCPTAEAYDQGGYEPKNTPFAKGIGEQIMEAGVKLLQSLKS